MRVNLEDFFVMSAPDIDGARLYFRNPKDKKDVRLVAEYDREWSASRLPGSHGFWVSADIRSYCKKNGLEFE